MRPGVVRDNILASWTRSQDWNVPPDHFELPYESDPDRDSRLTYSAGR